MGEVEDRETARRARAAARARLPMPLEVIRSHDESPALYEAATVEERLAAMTRLCRTAWLVSGRELPSCARGELPGEIFEIEHGSRRRAP